MILNIQNLSSKYRYELEETIMRKGSGSVGCGTA